MNLTRSEFDDLYAERKLRIAFVGMSNIGKSYTAKRLATDYDFNLIEVDKLIWEELGHNDMAAFAEWQGQPYSEGYQEREAHSIKLETLATQKALAINENNHILDTTGSVIYTGERVLASLKKTHYIVHIAASETDIERLKIQYFKQPKPLIWNGHFEKNSEQSNREGIISSYTKLLAARSSAYEALANQTLASAFILNPNIQTQDIFEALKPPV